MRELEERLYKHINTLIERYPKLEGARQSIIDAYLIMEECYEMEESFLLPEMAVQQRIRSILRVS